MFCSHCGKEIMDEAEICVGCGCRVKHQANNNFSAFGISGIICSISFILLMILSLCFISTILFIISALGVLVGLGLSIVGAIWAKSGARICSIIGIVVSIVGCILFILCL